MKDRIQGVLRVPLFPVDKCLKLFELSQFDKHNEFLIKEMESNVLLRFCIQTASPSLYSSYTRYRSSAELLSQKQINRLFDSLSRYFIRICSRATPFGLFAQLGIVVLDKTSPTGLQYRVNEIGARLRLDMSFLLKLSSILETKYRTVLKWRVNTSLYQIDGQFRYVEASLKKENNHRIFELQNVERNIVLDAIVGSCHRDYLDYDSLIQIIVDNGYVKDESVRYIDELIDNQILVSEIEPNTTVEYYWGRLLSKFKDFEPWMLEVDNFLCKLEMQNPTKWPLDWYANFHRVLSKSNIDHNKAQLIQIDSHTKFPGSLNQSILKEMNICHHVLWYLKESVHNRTLDRFRRRFYERYENQMVPLIKALDSEYGDSYKSASSIQDLYKSNKSGTWSRFDRLRWRKIKESLYQKTKVVRIDELSDQVSENFELPYDHFAFLSAMKNNKVLFRYTSGPPATTILGRFAYLNNDFKHLFDQYEQKDTEDFIYAEIVHLPQGRNGNIIFRPSNTEFEIEYLGKSLRPKENKISIRDLYVGVKSNKLVLWCPRLNKYVIPRLSCAHNFSGAGLPIYHFLADLQYQDSPESLFWDWGMFSQEEFLPRIEFMGNILSRAKWNIFGNSEKDFHEALQKAIEHFHLPKLVYIIQGDNQLLVNSKTKLGKHLLLQAYSRGQGKLLIHEACLEETEDVVKQDNGDNYIHELIVPVKSSRLPSISRLFKKPNEVDYSVRYRHFVHDWIYAKIYLSPKVANKLILELAGLFETEEVKNWFFIRYSDPQFHIRVRLNTNGQSKYNLYLLIDRFLCNKMSLGVVSTYSYNVYQRELERYSLFSIELSETLFYANTRLVISTLRNKAITEDKNFLIALAAFISLQIIFSACDETNNEVINFVRSIRLGFESEFRADKNAAIRQSVKEQYRKSRRILDGLITGTLTLDHYGINVIELQQTLKILNYRDVQEDYKNEFIAAHIHMFINRLFHLNQRFNELLVYSCIEKSMISLEARKTT